MPPSMAGGKAGRGLRVALDETRNRRTSTRRGALFMMIDLVLVPLLIDCHKEEGTITPRNNRNVRPSPE